MTSEALQRIEELTEELSATQDLLLNLYKHSLDGLIIADNKANFRYANPALEKILGYSSEELKDKSILDFMCEEGVARAKTKLNKLHEESTPIIKHRNKWIAKDGSLVRICWTATTTPTDDFIYIVGRKLDHADEPL